MKADLGIRLRLLGPMVLAVSAGLLAIVVAFADLRSALFWSAIFILGFVAAVPLLSDVVRGSRHRSATQDALAPAPIFGLVSFLMFGLGALYRWTGSDPNGSRQDPLPGLLMAAVGVVAFAAGYYLPLSKRSNGWASRLPTWRPQRAIVAGFLCITIGVAGSVISFAAGQYFFGTNMSVSIDVNSTVGYFAGFLFIGLSILSVTAYSNQDLGGLRFVVAALGVGFAAFLLPTGHRYYLVLVLAAIWIPRHYFKKRISMITIALALGFVTLVVVPIGQMWRSEYTAQHATRIQDIPRVASGVVNQLSALDPQQYLNYAVGDRFQRLDHATILSALRSAVPSKVGFKYGQTYVPIITWVIPRPLWHDKPDFQFYNEVGRETGLLSATNFDTSILYTSIGELYLNFGDVGIVFGMLVIGLVFVRLYRALVAGPPNQTAVFAYSLMITSFWGVEEALGPSLASGIRATLSGLAVLWLVGALDLRRTAPYDSRDIQALSLANSFDSVRSR